MVEKAPTNSFAMTDIETCEKYLSDHGITFKVIIMVINNILDSKTSTCIHNS